jgi:hypothetical protein
MKPSEAKRFEKKPHTRREHYRTRNGVTVFVAQMEVSARTPAAEITPTKERRIKTDCTVMLEEQMLKQARIWGDWVLK